MHEHIQISLPNPVISSFNNGIQMSNDHILVSNNYVSAEQNFTLFHFKKIILYAVQQTYFSVQKF